MENKADLMSERLLNFAAAVVKIVRKTFSNQINRHIGMQLLRSATSVGANYEEARGAESRQDFSHKMQIILKEARESLFWLKLIAKSEILKEEEISEIINENKQICDIIAKSVKTLKSTPKK
jgi:four helix bundle protein